MSDRELLEYAAKAAGYTDILPYKWCGLTFDDLWVKNKDGNHGRWNPLTDDGDALRLAVMLGIDISDAQVTYWDKHGTDPYAATRRAITRAAAEIGKAMK